jgi:hypothetical protein
MALNIDNGTLRILQVSQHKELSIQVHVGTVLQALLGQMIHCASWQIPTGREAFINPDGVRTIPGISRKKNPFQA